MKVVHSIKFLIFFAVSFALACPVWNRSDVNAVYGRSQCIVKVYDAPETTLEEYYNYEGFVDGENPIDDESYEASAYDDIFSDAMLNDLKNMSQCGMSFASGSYKLWFLLTSFIAYFAPLLAVLYLIVAAAIKLRTCELFNFHRMVVLFLASAVCLAPINAYKLSTYFGVDLDRENCALFGLIASVVAHLSTVILPLLLVLHAYKAGKERGQEYDQVSEEKKALTSRSDEFLA